ncbi:MAG TPA: GspH/FimT family pseudopilin [Noviherbaspirillum sp.]|jgi:type IV fimbrial biogenesis protein FimT|nr:GspH/FimT family pseudopilin [Noviherbaspirillum sp.]
MLICDKLIQRGFSAIELMVVLAVAIILLAIGIPSVQAMIRHQQITTTVNDFFASIHLARSEAIQHGIRVDLVPSDGAGDWSKGWVIFVDGNNNQRPDKGERIVFSHDRAHHGIRITAALTDSKVQYLAYHGSGRTRTNTSSQQTQFGTLTFQLDNQTRKIKLNFLGRPRVCNPDTERSTC